MDPPRSIFERTWALHVRPVPYYLPLLRFDLTAITETKFTSPDAKMWATRNWNLADANRLSFWSHDTHDEYSGHGGCGLLLGANARSNSPPTSRPYKLHRPYYATVT